MFASFKAFTLIFCLIFLTIFTRSLANNFHFIPKKPDSLRSTQINGQRAIIYSIGPKETFYSVARKYHVDPKLLMRFNPNSKTLSIGQEILIPRGKSIALINPIQTQVIYIKKGQTLFSVSQEYGVKLEELVTLNALKDHSLHIGQKIKVPQKQILKESHENSVETKSSELNTKSIPKTNGSLLSIPKDGTYMVGSGETIYSIGFKYGVTVDEIRNLNQIQNNEIKVGQVLRLRSDATKVENNETTKSSEPKETMVNPPIKIINSPSEAHRSKTIPREFKEEGMGIWVDNNDLNQAKSVALHKQAPVGTVIKVTNPMSKRSIFVKVVGSFPETEETKNAILVISKSAATLIGALDPHFRVELSYAY